MKKTAYLAGINPVLTAILGGKPSTVGVGWTKEEALEKAFANFEFLDRLDANTTPQQTEDSKEFLRKAFETGQTQIDEELGWAYYIGKADITEAQFAKFEQLIQTALERVANNKRDLSAANAPAIYN